jgi:hypothetical protein
MCYIIVESSFSNNQICNLIFLGLKIFRLKIGEADKFQLEIQLIYFDWSSYGHGTFVFFYLLLLLIIQTYL